MTLHPEAFYAALAATPRLPGALCKGRAELFDQQPGNAPERGQAESRALALCRRWPALASCTVWYEGLPANERPPGLVAGRINRRSFTRVGG